MGLIKAGLGAIGGTLADQWKEYFYCDSIPMDVLVTKGSKRTSKRSSNTRGEENIISNGAVIAVNEGQCMMIVEQGKVVEFSAEAGEFVWDSSTEPSIFVGGLGKGILNTFKTIGKRFTLGGDTGKDQRIYFFNIKEIIGNKYGTANPVPFRVVDHNIGLDMDIGIRCFGEYSYRISDPMLFYANVCGNVADQFYRNEIDGQLKSELLTALQPAFAQISSLGIRYSALPGHTEELSAAMNEALTDKWKNLRGVELVSMGVSSVSAEEEDENTIKELQRSAVFRNPNMAAAHLVGAQAEAMKSAAQNEQAGAFAAFMGMNMAQNAGGASPQALYQMGQTPQQGAQPASSGAHALDSWKCPECGTSNEHGKFCANCGAAKPQDGWKCSCGAINQGNFCQECGKQRPKGAPLYRCDKCGWKPADPTKPPKFCPECGDRFDDDDIED